MKKFILLLLIIVESNVFAQTDSIEKSILYKKLTSNKLDDFEFSNTWKQWNQKVKTDKYPDQPLDQDEQVHYTFINDYKGFDKEYLFNRILEWLTINYSLLPYNVYSNLKDGKIIYILSLNLFDNYSCIQSSIITIKDEKIRFEFINILYQAFYEADYENGLSERTVNLNVYPIILKKQSEWDLNFSLLRETKRLFNSEVMKLNDYILSYKQFNDF